MNTNSSTYVYKFGGTSVRDPQRIRLAVSLTTTSGDAGRKIVVVSALGGVTDQLLQAVELAEMRDPGYHAYLEEIARRHEQVLLDVVASTEQAGIRTQLEKLWHYLGELLDGVFLLRECTARTRDALIGMGERAAAPLVAAAFRAADISASVNRTTRSVFTQ